MKLLGALVTAGLLVALAACPNDAKNESTNALNAGNKALGQKQLETAINEYEHAIEKNRDNHLAWYGMGLAYIEKQDYDKASDSLQHTVDLAPDQPMYQMWYGISLYDKAVQDAAQTQAARLNKKPEEIDPDLSAVNFEKPQQHLQEAVKLNSDMWRAHYFLGRIDRATDKPKDAAEEFTKAIQANPREAGPYVALGELYRHWDYTDQAIQVASQGVANVPGSNEVSEIWYVLGMGYDDKQQEDKAIEAFGKAIEAKKDNHKAKFQRGQAYFRKGDMDDAKRDLEEFSKSGGASLEFAKQQASKMLMDIAAKAAGADHPGSSQKQSPEDVVNKGKTGFHPPPKKH
ncbi:MAG TPA: tetratricopeptide repeat protein [Kofleriaceae bacterium]|nr:tetratricopeptide repeat protein [Kofleriaceae bacterium]